MIIIHWMHGCNRPTNSRRSLTLDASSHQVSSKPSCPESQPWSALRRWLRTTCVSCTPGASWGGPWSVSRWGGGIGAPVPRSSFAWYEEHARECKWGCGCRELTRITRAFFHLINFEMRKLHIDLLELGKLLHGTPKSANWTPGWKRQCHKKLTVSCIEFNGPCSVCPVVAKVFLHFCVHRTNQRRPTISSGSVSTNLMRNPFLCMTFSC